ncbi:ABC transporter ATP-binding protein [Paenibacillus sp. FSL R7-0204]|uniref:ABC transporter ATP-binding protein n=1 Tax=Paenibacillus sp. FSL R7-0204 TaxID=2921675 RepID=UPI0030FC153D
MLFFCIYLVYGIITVEFSRQLGLSLDVAQGKDQGAFDVFLLRITIITAALILLYLIYGYLESQYSKRVMITVRTKLLNGIVDNTLPDFLQTGEAAFTSDLINDIKVLETNYIKPAIEVTKEVLLLIITLVALLKMNVWVTLFIVVVSFIPILLPNLFMKTLEGKMDAYSRELQHYTLRTGDFLAGYEVFKNYQAEARLREKHQVYNEALALQKRKTFLFLDFLSNSVAISSIMITIGVLLVGMFLAINGRLTIGEVFAVSFISTGISAPLGNIGNYLPKIRGAKTFVLKYNSLIPVPVPKPAIPSMKECIEAEDVSLTLNSNLVLQNISLRLEKGRRYAVVGASGSGKSSLIKLIMGYYNDYTGEIRIDQTSISASERSSIFEFMSSISQNMFLFQASIRENLTLFDPEIHDGRIWTALEAVGLKQQIEALDQGLDKGIEEGGKNFSGGEKQRLSIARALLRSKDLLVMDEATSALDEGSYLEVENSISTIPGLTLISITHRLNSEVLSHYDEVITLNKGRIVEKGSFSELMESKGYFYELYMNQENTEQAG